MKILLAGDSWGCGVWTYNPPHPAKVIHKGIEQFMLDDGHEVINVSDGGLSPSQISLRITKPLEQHNFDYIFVFETSAIRDTGCMDAAVNTTKWFDNYEHLININNIKRLEFYSKLDSLDTTIFLLGGCSKVDTELVKDFKNIQVVIPSIPEFLSPGYTALDIYPDYSWIKQIDKKWDLETIDKLLEQRKKWFWLNKNCSHFKEDNAHPDRHGYEKVYNYIKENVFK